MESIKSMKNLLDLTLSFDKVDVKRSMNKENKAILEALQPPPNLVKLRIEHYEGRTLFPVWMVSLTNLRELTLSECMNCEYLPLLGKLSALESLKIYSMKSVKRVGNEFLQIINGGTAFLKLETLEFRRMDEWEEWDIKKKDNEDITVLPCLQSLRIDYYNKLKDLPDRILQLTTLKELKIGSYDILNQGGEIDSE